MHLANAYSIRFEVTCVNTVVLIYEEFANIMHLFIILFVSIT